jgi:hypothetical protein
MARLPADDVLAAARERWTETGLATGLATGAVDGSADRTAAEAADRSAGSAADRSAAEAAVRDAYRAAGRPEPRHILWYGSPSAGALAAARLTGALPATGTATGAATEAAAGDADRPLGTVAPGPALRAQLRTAPWAAARATVHEALGPAGWARLWLGSGAPVWRLVMDRVAGPLRARLREDLPAPARTALLDAVYGQHDASWLAAFAAAGAMTPALDALAALAETAGWWWPYAEVAILTERPVALHRDNVGRLHHGDGPALAYPDGYALHAWRGMPIPTDLVAELPHLTAERIGAERNAELRRVMLEHYGYERYLRESGAQRVQSDECGTLWRLTFRNDEALTMVEVVNSTPEPDGVHRVYWLRVPPGTGTAREGVAWTFGLTAEEYAPLVQT